MSWTTPINRPTGIANQTIVRGVTAVGEPIAPAGATHMDVTVLWEYAVAPLADVLIELRRHNSDGTVYSDVGEKIRTIQARSETGVVRSQTWVGLSLGPQPFRLGIHAPNMPGAQDPTVTVICQTYTWRDDSSKLQSTLQNEQ